MELKRVHTEFLLSVGPHQVLGSWILLIAIFTLCVQPLWSQVPVPFNSNTGKVVVFNNKRFTVLDKKPAKQFFAMEGQVVYEDHDGGLKIYDPMDKTLFLLEEPKARTIRASQHRIAWLCGDTLLTVRSGSPKVITTGVVKFTVTDSSIVYLDTISQQIAMDRKGQHEILAEVTNSSEKPQWSHAGGNVILFEKASRRILQNSGGKMNTLCDSTDVGIVSVGEHIIGYWDEEPGLFKVQYNGVDNVIGQLRPSSAQAGRNMLAWIDGAGGLRCILNGESKRITQDFPSGYWVIDDLLVFLDAGALKVYDGERVTEVEKYVPEKWAVHYKTLVYLDLNRELIRVENGQSERIDREANIADFDLFGDAVGYPGPLGTYSVLLNGKEYEY